MNVTNATPISPVVQQSVINQEAKVRAQNAFPKAEEANQLARRPEAPDQSRQKANLEASNWRTIHLSVSVKAEAAKAAMANAETANAETARGSDGLANYTDLPNKRTQQAAAAYKAMEKPEQRASVDAIV
jgi:UDP-N-acetylmuramoylalanine-D-glutamate ligase